jgi:hypothetical protein
LLERCWRGNRRGTDEGATPARAAPVSTSAFLIDVAVLGLASHLPGARHTVAWWYSVAVAAVVTIAVVLTYRRITVASALATWVWNWSADMWNWLQPASTWPGWRHLKHFDGYATSFWVSPPDITSETLDRLWLHDTDATVVTIRLTVAAGRAEVSAWVRYHSRERLGKDVWAGLNRLTGRQLAAVQASLPAPATRPPLVVPARALDDHEQLAVRVGPTVVGATPQTLDAPG